MVEITAGRGDMTYRLIAIATAVLLGALGGGLRAEETKTAIFAGGCFWCVESDFDRIPGVTKTVSGYTGGSVPDPTYAQVTAEGTGHFEAVRITYDPSRVGYAELLTAFWHSVDPTDPDGQFCDRGESYRTAVFVADEEERRLAETSKRAAEATLGKPVVTTIAAAGPFFPAEDYHQDYYKKNPMQYHYYRWACGRNKRIEQLWGEQAYKGIPDHG
jgi:peptide-methionine (S)-S-oxide reductase